jgi:ADP-ribose pyrophosphatase
VKSSSILQHVPGWEIAAEETHFHSPHLRVVSYEMRSPAQPAGRHWTVVHRKAAVVVAPLTVDGKLVLIRQERVPIRATIWEVPAGQIDQVREAATASARAVALRELREETGYELAEGGELVPLGHFFSSPGFTDEEGYFFLARPVQPSASGHAHDDSESILDCAAFTPGELRDMIARDEIRDANTLGICARLIAAGHLSFDN